MTLIRKIGGVVLVVVGAFLLTLIVIPAFIIALTPMIGSMLFVVGVNLLED